MSRRLGGLQQRRQKGGEDGGKQDLVLFDDHADDRLVVQHDLDKVVDVLPEGLAQLLQLGVDLAVSDVEEVLAEETVVVHHELE